MMIVPTARLSGIDREKRQLPRVRRLYELREYATRVHMRRQLRNALLNRHIGQIRCVQGARQSNTNALHAHGVPSVPERPDCLGKFANLELITRPDVAVLFASVN